MRRVSAPLAATAATLALLTTAGAASAQSAAVGPPQPPWPSAADDPERIYESPAGLYATRVGDAAGVRQLVVQLDAAAGVRLTGLCRKPTLFTPANSEEIATVNDRYEAHIACLNRVLAAPDLKTLGVDEAPLRKANRALSIHQWAGRGRRCQDNPRSGCVANAAWAAVEAQAAGLTAAADRANRRLGSIYILHGQAQRAGEAAQADMRDIQAELDARNAARGRAAPRIVQLPQPAPILRAPTTLPPTVFRQGVN